MRTDAFHYDLSPEYIAQSPAEPRDASRLMVLHRATGQLEHRTFREIGDYFEPGDVLVANDSRVIPARLFAKKEETGGKVELLLLEKLGERRWLVMAGGRRLTEGVKFLLDDKDGTSRPLLSGVISAVHAGTEREVTFSQPIEPFLPLLGHTPLPPYIHEHLPDPERYQTVYSRPAGSAAAPTAGLHFTGELLLSLRQKGVLFETVTLHVGLDTFKPVSAERVSEHTIHSEWATVAPESARRMNDAKLAGGRIVAVGTTTTRVLETAALRASGYHGSLREISMSDAQGATDPACPWRPIAAFSGQTDLYIFPGYRFRAVDALITNFHLPRSSLLMMVSAFTSRQEILHAYQVAIEEAYRFYSFGDAMLIL